MAAINQNGYDLCRTWTHAQLADFFLSILPNVFQHFKDLEAASPQAGPQWLLGNGPRSKLQVVPLPRPTGFDVEYHGVPARTSFRNVQIFICIYRLAVCSFCAYNATVARYPIAAATYSAWMDAEFLTFGDSDPVDYDGALWFLICNAIGLPFPPASTGMSRSPSPEAGSSAPVRVRNKRLVSVLSNEDMALGSAPSSKKAKTSKGKQLTSPC